MKKSIAIVLLSMLLSGVAYAEWVPDFVYGSYSRRTPNLRPNPTDYEISAGAQDTKYMAEFLIERESGSFYKGMKLNVLPAEWCELDYTLKEAQNIDSQSARFIYKPFKSVLYLDAIGIGASLNAREWQEAKVLPALTVRSKTLVLSIEGDFKQRISIFYKSGFDFPIGKKFVTQLFRKYQRNDTKEFSQEKMVVGYQFKEKGDE